MIASATASMQDSKQDCHLHSCKRPVTLESSSHVTGQATAAWPAEMPLRPFLAPEQQQRGVTNKGGILPQ